MQKQSLKSFDYRYTRFFGTIRHLTLDCLAVNNGWKERRDNMTKENKDNRAGIDSYLNVKPGDERPDKFETDESGAYHFPCSACVHVFAPLEFCRACRHWAI